MSTVRTAAPLDKAGLAGDLAYEPASFARIHASFYPPADFMH